MEVSTKFRIGKLAGAALLAHDFEAIIAQGFAKLAITVRHVRLGAVWRRYRREPHSTPAPCPRPEPGRSAGGRTMV